MRAIIIEKFYEDGIEEGFAFCKICKAKLRSERLSNLKRHIRTMHKVDIGALQSEQDAHCALKAENKPKRKKHIKIDISLSRLLRSCVGLVTEDNVPLNALYSGNLRRIMDPICRSIRKNTGQMTQLNAYTWGRSLQVVANDVRQTIREELNHKLLSIIVNTSNNSFIIMARFMEKELMRTVLLGLAEMESGSKKLNSIIEEVKNTLNKYSISLNRVVSITVGHKTDVCLNSITNLFENDTDEHFQDIKICQCVALVAYQCGQDVIYIDEIQKNLEICRQIAQFTDASLSYRKDFEFKDMRIPQIDCESRWESIYDMVCAIQSAKSIFKDLEYTVRDRDDKPYSIPLSLWDFIEGFMDAMGPLYRTLRRYQEEELNFNDFYAQWLKCKLSTEYIVKKSANGFKNQIGSAILDSMQSHDIENDCLFACLFMDPRFHRMLKPVQKATAVGFLKMLWDKMSDLNPEIATSVSSPKTAAVADIEDELLDKYLSENIEQISTIDSVNVHLKIDCLQLPFLKSDADVVKFWKDKRFSEPELYQLSKICFAIPPTQIISNSVSLAFDSIVRKNHDCSRETLENMLLVKLNSSHLDKAIVGCLPMVENFKGNETYANERLPMLENTANSWPELDEQSDANTSNNDSCVESNNSLNIKEELSKMVENFKGNETYANERLSMLENTANSWPELDEQSDANTFNNDSCVESNSLNIKEELSKKVENFKENETYANERLSMLENTANSWPELEEQSDANTFNNDSCVESNNSLNIKEELSNENSSSDQNSSPCNKEASIKYEKENYQEKQMQKNNESFEELKESVQESKNDQSIEDQNKRKGKSKVRRQKRSESLCVMCGKKFTTLHSLKTHMLQHSGKRNFKCSKCPKSFVCLSGLSTHEKIHTAHKPYVCEICGRSFRTRFELKLHKRYHTGTKNYQCDYCELRFIANGHKQRHMRIHTGEKPYSCKFCDRAFIQSNDLNKHLKQHLGDNIYECRFCDLKFPLLRDLRVHLTTHKDETGTQASILETRKVNDNNPNVV